MLRHLTADVVARRDETELLRWLEPRCRTICSNYFLPGGDFEDLMQEARAAAVIAIRDFRGTHPGHFVAFASLVIRRRVIDALSYARRHKRAVLTGAVSLQGGAGQGDAPGVPDEGAQLADVVELVQPSADETIEDRDRLRAAMADISFRLTELERRAIVGVVFEGRPYEELGDHKAIDNAIQRARRKLTQWDAARAA